MVDAVLQGVLETRLLDRAVDTDPPRNFDAHAIAREEHLRRFVGAVAYGHPLGVHLSSVTEGCPFYGWRGQSVPRFSEEISGAPCVPAIARRPAYRDAV